MEQSQSLVCGSVMELVQALIRRFGQPRVWVVSCGGEAAEVGEEVSPWQSTLSGLLASDRSRALGAGWCMWTWTRAGSEASAEALAGELREAGSEREVSYRGDRRLVARLERWEIAWEEGRS